MGEAASDLIANANETVHRTRTARFRQIADSLREAILSGEYRANDHLPTEHELARQHGVSRVTAAAALGELARSGLVTRTPRRGTLVRPGAAYSRDASRMLVAWVTPNLEQSFGFGLLRGIDIGARKDMLGLLVAVSGADHDQEGKVIRDMVALGAAGLMIFIQDGESYNAEVLRLVLGGYPIVLVDRYLRGVRCAVVSSDNVAGARLLVRELLDAGHRHICVVTFPPSGTSTIEDRMRGYVQALTAAKVPVDYSLHYIDSDMPSIRVDWEPEPAAVQHFMAFLETHPDVTAIFATNAILGLLALRALERLALRVPADMSLVCIDPLEAIPLSLPAVTTAVQQAEAIGVTAVALLQEVLAGKAPRTVLLPMELRRAGSVGPPRDRRWRT
jgi:GntR family transcriptional regulator, arabinose operon transcriptional repressor